MQPFFTIITPTYKRKDSLSRAISSVLSQTYKHFEMIIVNDSPEDMSYLSLEETIIDTRIRYFKNPHNEGVNRSRNRGLLEARESSWVIFLDDDDYLAPDALEYFVKMIEKHTHVKWFITDRVLANKESITKAPHNNTTYSYAWDYLIGKKISGDVTHCIYKETIGKTIFSTHIKQGEEWLFFYGLGLSSPMFYSSHASTLTDGYGVLNFRQRPKKERVSTFFSLCKEGLQRNYHTRISFIVYIMARFLLLIIR